MTLGELRAWIRRQAPELLASQVSDVQLNQLLNEGYKIFAARSGCFIRDVTVSVSANTTTVEMPAEVVDVITITQGNTKLLWAFAEDMEVVYGANWRSQTGTPQYVIKISPTVVRPVPTPTSAQSWTVQAVVAPVSSSSTIPILSNDNDSPKMPEAYHVALAYYAMHQLALMNPQAPMQVARAQQYWMNFIEMVEAFKTEMGKAIREATLLPLAQAAPQQS